MAAKINSSGDWKDKTVNEILEKALPTDLLISEINPEINLESETD